MFVHKSLIVVLLLSGLVTASIPVLAARESNISASKHNLSAYAPAENEVKATNSADNEICVFCHTPHGANTASGGPLWNRELSGQSYKSYSSSSLDAGVLQAPGGSSKLCLSCHDGTIAIGAVSNNAGLGKGAALIEMTGTSGDKMPANKDGFTRLLGVDLTNDHPISVTYDATLAALDGELEKPSGGLKQEVLSNDEVIVGARGIKGKPLLPLEKAGGPNSPAVDGQVQCGTCHDPHIIETEFSKDLGVSIKFLRANRFQLADPVGGGFNKKNDINCLACHNKEGWESSAHAMSETASEAYNNATATTNREFPPDLPVYKAACLNCHDTHTETGAQRLTREGADISGKPAIEETCYQCHGNSAIVNTGGVLAETSDGVPNIEVDFGKSIHMPITTSDQAAASPSHDIEDADFTESPAKMGKGVANLDKRHAECTDCHNPHRMRRGARFYDTYAQVRRTHTVNGSLAGTYGPGSDGNIASGPLRGTFGVEPVADTSDWGDEPTGYDIKQGDPGISTSIAVGETYLTREYQLCFKCHSNYSMDKTNMPSLGGSGKTANPTNGMTKYTNVAAEFSSVRANLSGTGQDQGEANGTPPDPTFGCLPGDDADTAGACKNHRSWHPVMYPTGRTASERRDGDGSFSNVLTPFSSSTGLGTQTMYCSDCHGSEVSWTVGSGPNLGQVQGPHGSNNPFLLKGVWTTAVRPNNIGGSICGNCHNPRNTSGGFSNGDASHGFDPKDRRPCMYCHIAVPHGWKNKAFLVNLECVGSEVDGYPAGCTDTGSSGTFNLEPYYYNAFLRIRIWQNSRRWTENSCGNPNMNDDWYGKTWMEDRC